MKIFMDTADVDEIVGMAELGIVSEKQWNIITS